MQQPAAGARRSADALADSTSVIALTPILRLTPRMAGRAKRNRVRGVIGATK
jgi:hypothetical protein